MPLMNLAEYRVTRLDKKFAPSDETFKVAKFTEEAGDQPENVYFVSWDKRKDEMLCNCPNRRRGKHVDDKHGKMVRDWLSRGEPVGFYDQDGEFHEQPHLAANPAAATDESGLEPEYGDFPDDEAPPNGDLDGDEEDEYR